MESPIIMMDDKLFDRRVELLDTEGNIRSLGEIEKEVIVSALEHYRGRVSEAARRLKMSRSTLYRKMEGFKIRQVEEMAV